MARKNFWNNSVRISSYLFSDGASMKVKFFDLPYILHIYDYPSTKAVKAHIIQKPVKHTQDPNPIVILEKRSCE